jgi:hypothetical protein
MKQKIHIDQLLSKEAKRFYNARNRRNRAVTAIQHLREAVLCDLNISLDTEEDKVTYIEEINHNLDYRWHLNEMNKNQRKVMAANRIMDKLAYSVRG